MLGSVMGVMKMGLEPASLAFQVIVLPLHHIGSLMSPLYPHLRVYVAPLPQRSLQTSTLVTSIDVISHWV